MEQFTPESELTRNEPVRTLGGNFRTFMSGHMGKAMSLLSARSVNSFLSLLFTLMAGRILTVEEHGIYGKVLASIVVFQAITELGMQFTLVRFLSPAIRNGDTDTINSVIRASLKLKGYAFGVTLLFMLGYLSFVILNQFYGLLVFDSGLQILNPDNMALFWLIFLGGAGMSIVSYLDAVLISHEYYFRLSMWIPSVGALRILMLGILYYEVSEGIRSEHVAFAYAFAPYLSMVFYFLIFPGSFFLGSVHSERVGPWIRKLLSFNVWIFAASMMSIISDWIEVLMITNVHDTGLYSAARLPMQGFLIVLSTMQSFLLPRFSGLSQKDEFSSIFKKIYKVIVPGALLLIPPGWLFVWFIPAWYGSSYEPSVNVFLILYPNFIMRILFAPLGTALFALDQPRLIAVEAGIRMIFGILLNLYLIPRAGIMGAAVANLLAQIAGWTFLSIVYYIYFTRGRFPYDERKAVTSKPTGGIS